jgi:hypothetical protein
MSVPVGELGRVGNATYFGGDEEFGGSGDGDGDDDVAGAIGEG